MDLQQPAPETAPETPNKKAISTTREVLGWITLGVLSMVLLLIILAAVVERLAEDYDRTAIPYLNEVLPEMLSWDTDVAWGHMSNLARQSVDRDVFDEVYVELAVIGKLEELGQPVFLSANSSATTSSGYRKDLFYAVPAVFTEAEAVVRVTIDARTETYRLHHIMIESPFFEDDVTTETAEAGAESQ